MNLLPGLADALLFETLIILVERTEQGFVFRTESPLERALRTISVVTNVPCPKGADNA